MYSNPHPRLLHESSGALFSCRYLGDPSITIIPTSAIMQIVSMNPHDVDGEQRFFMFEQPENDVTNLGGFLVDEDDMQDAEDDEEVGGESQE